MGDAGALATACQLLPLLLPSKVRPSHSTTAVALLTLKLTVGAATA